MNHKPVMLLIRDGWGINPGGRDRAMDLAISELSRVRVALR